MTETTDEKVRRIVDEAKAQLNGHRPAPPPNDEAFWQARPELEHVRRFARARMVSPEAVLAVVLCRVLAPVPPFVVLPPIVGGAASLNLFAALVGESGAGKGAGERAGEDAVEIPGVETAGVGSGEGICHLYAHREESEIVRDRDSVLFSVPEVDTLSALGGRQGSTLTPELRKAWSGERLGFSYVDPAKRLPIAAHSYRLGLLLGVQPARARPLLEAADGGMPQRFLWPPTDDPAAPDVTPAEPAQLPRPASLEGLWPPARNGRHILTVPAVAVDAIRSARLARLRGEGDALDGHALLCRLKAAAALCFLSGRRAVSESDWEVSGALMEISDRTRQRVVTELRQAAVKANKARGRAEGERSDIAAEAADRQAVRRVARLIREHLDKHGESAWTDERNRLHRRSRQHFEEAVDLLVEVGDVEKVTTEHGARRLRLSEAS